MLKRRYEKAISKAGVRIAVAEISGTSLKQRLQKSDPFKEKRCEKEGCLVCAEGDGGRCRINGVTYELTCKSCNDVYVGETSRNAYTRGLAHIASVSAPHNPQTTHRDGKPVPKSTLKHHVDTVHATDSTPLDPTCLQDEGNRGVWRRCDKKTGQRGSKDQEHQRADESTGRVAPNTVATSGLVMKSVCLPVYLPACLPACWSVCLSCRDVNIGGGRCPVLN